MPIVPLLDLLRRAPEVIDDLRVGRMRAEVLLPAALALIAAFAALQSILKLVYKMVKLAAIGATVVGAFALWRSRQARAAVTG